jgi:hypothetical protein
MPLLGGRDYCSTGFPIRAISGHAGNGFFRLLFGLLGGAR